MTVWYVQPCPTSKLATLYRVSDKIMRGYLKRLKAKLGPRVGYFWNVRQIEIVLSEIGNPSGVKIIFPDPRSEK